MSKTSILSLAAAALVASTLSFAPAAEAGGMRLKFGGPLGSFVASPTPGYGGGSSYSKASYGAKKCAPKSKQYASRKPNVKVARHIEKPAPRVVRHVERSEPRVAAYQPAPKRLVTRSIVKAPAETAVLDTNVAATAVVTDTNSSGSQALAAGSLPAAEKLEVAKLTPETVPAVAAPEAVKAETQGEAAADTAKTETVAAAGPQTCKKFIPAVGVTVTVGCER